MLDRIVALLNANQNISDWKLTQRLTKANELFLIKNQIEMPRSKRVHKISATVYIDFTEADQNYRGSSTFEIHPTMTDAEIAAAIESAAFAAGYIKNPYYPVPGPTDAEVKSVESAFASAPLADWMPKIKEALYHYDQYEKGHINSSEIFLDKSKITLMNSKGLHYSFENYKGHIEFITNWQEDGEEIELYHDLMFSDYNPEALSQVGKEMLEMSKEKASTMPTPNMRTGTVILQGAPVTELLKYYYAQSSAQNVYQHISLAKPGESIQGTDMKGDKISLTLEPMMKNSPFSDAVDEDGLLLSTTPIIEEGILKKYWGSQQYCHYLNVDPVGKIFNLAFEGGSQSLAEMRAVPHLEIAAFSDFQMDVMTGNFAGEIRLGWYFDGNKRITVSGGSISGNINNIQTDMILSRELQECSVKDFVQPLYYKGPTALLMKGVSIAGS